MSALGLEPWTLCFSAQSPDIWVWSITQNWPYFECTSREDDPSAPGWPFKHTQNLSLCRQSIKPSVHKEEGFTSTASNSSPIPASAETLWLIDWLPVRPPVLSVRRASGKSIRQKGSQREALSPPAGTPAPETPLVLVNDPDRFQINSQELKSAQLHFLFLRCCWVFVIKGHLLVSATKTHIDTHTIQCAHTPLNASSAAAASIVIDFPALMVEALVFKMPDSIGDPGTRNNYSLLWWGINNKPFQNNCWFY